ncbi:hypothetical protein [Brassicibacter mesophilus]|uniref:hypothetical protein n=1 Tax=Brassicibacter mesophilus TaxID=745119 RepID=UPI003D19CA8D
MMARKVLLVEPNYKNKYPPMGLMKLSTYHKMLGDDVRFYKGDLQQFILEETYQELLQKLKNNDNKVDWTEHKELILGYLKKGLRKNYEQLCQLSQDSIVHENLKFYRDYYSKKKYFENPKWDRICITTLFTFYWQQTISTINFFKKLCKDINEVKIGGIAASVVPNEIERETGIYPFVGLLDKGGEYDSDNSIIIDHLPLDYSILEEIDYVYPEHDGYYGYMTRGCVNKCAFCAVPKIEPRYNNFISVKDQIEYVKEHFGEKRNLLLLDNNVLASERFNEIIDEIKACGFDKNTKYVAPNQYAVAIKGLQSGYNDRGYIKSIVKQYKQLNTKVNDEDQIAMFEILKENKLLEENTAQKDLIMSLNDYFSPFFERFYNNKPKERYVDFNQGIDARLLTKERMKKLAEIPIRPLRIAFDDWKLRDIYERAVRVAAEFGITNMSNYLLYNYNDYPVDLYYRMKLNIDLCEDLGVSIYSFPMKYHPIQDPDYFRNRTYTGKHWNRKFIRAIQAVLNSTKGKVGRGKSFFEEAFGIDEKEFEKLLYMPETMIVYRMHYKNSGMTEQWWTDFNNIDSKKLDELKRIIHANDFNNIEELTSDKDILHVLEYYTIQREDAEKVLNLKK